MKIEKEVNVILTVKELTEIVKQHLKEKNIEVESVWFDIEQYYENNGYPDAHPDHRLKEVRCKGKL